MPAEPRSGAGLVLAAARYIAAGDPTPLHDRAGEAIDWGEVFRSADWHDLLPLLHTALEETGYPGVPEEIRARLRERFYFSARRNLQLTVNLLDLLARLGARGIPALPLKGAVLSNTVYRNAAHREFGDIDLLIRPSDVAGAHELLESLGFVPWPNAGIEDGLGPVRGSYERGFDRRSDATTVDLHWGFAPGAHGLRLSVEEAFDAAETVEIAGRPVRVLTPELTVITLCLHGAKHGPFPWPRLKWVLDIAELVRARPALDWGEVLSRADELGCARMVRVGLCLASDLLEVRLPEEVMAAIQCDPAAVVLAGRVQERLLAAPDGLDRRFPRIDFDLRVRERPWDRLRYAVARAVDPGPRDREMVALPGTLSFLYYPIRIGRLALEYGLRPFRLRRLVREGAPDE